MILLAAACAVVVAIALALVRAALGPSVYDRLQAANTIGTCATILLALMCFLNGRPEFIDLALVYGLLNVIATIAILRFFKLGNLG
jgi:multicomponent Na+:H+ antiporter subunit F